MAGYRLDHFGFCFFFFNDTATTEIYTLSLHDALPIYRLVAVSADADDIVSVTFLEAWRRADAVRFVNGSILPWLLVTATNSARNLARSSRRYRAMLERLPIDPHDDDRATDSFDSEAHDALRRLSLADPRILTLCVR